MFLIFNEEVRKVLLGAKEEMKKLRHPYVGTEHLVLSILKKDNFVSNKLKEYNVTYDIFKKCVVNILGMGNSYTSWFLYTPLLKKIIENSIVLSKDKNCKDVSLNVLFLSLLEESEGVAIRIFSELNVDIDKLYDEINLFKVNKKNKSKLMIDDFGVNLNKKVTDNDIDPVIGRDKEVERIIEILCRRTKNNPLLIGDAGVGKTSIVEELSRRIVDENVPNKLLNKRIVSISMANLVSGTKYRGEFEERITKLLKEVEENNDSIIFIDEIHTLVGAGGAEGAIDASNILKPALARGKINIIGATTVNEYKKFIEDDKALARRFQNVIISEPNIDTVYDILSKLKPIYEEFHNVSISNEILRLIVDLSNKYLYDRKQPDKSIDILDEVCSKVSVIPNKYSSKNLYYKGLLKTIVNLKNEAIINNKFNEAIYLKEEESKLEDHINRLDIKMMNNKLDKRNVTKEMVADVIKEKSNIPVFELLEFNDITSDMIQNLSSKVYGQKNAISSLVKNTKKILMGVKYNNSPNSFLFVGSTGVGKTLLAKEYGKILFGENNIIRIDMSEYKEEHSISKIIGSPPGYVGYQNKRSLLEEIKDKPYSLLLLDEIEKAHSSVLNLFLQILDEGKIKDSSGEVVRFDNVVIIMTSNALCKNNMLGFNNEMNSSISCLSNYFNLEFINRIGNILYFNSLSYDDIKEIVVNRLKYYISKMPFDYKYDDLFVESIINESNYEVFGARKIEKIIVDKLEDIAFDVKYELIV